MAKFKELTIRKVPQSSLPHLRLHGKWLEQLDFTVGTSVTAIYKDTCLTITTDNLEQLEEPAFTACVSSRIMGKKPRTQLFLNGLLLKRYGFNIGDKVGLTLETGKIQIQKINRFTVANQN